MLISNSGALRAPSCSRGVVAIRTLLFQRKMSLNLPKELTCFPFSTSQAGGRAVSREVMSPSLGLFFQPPHLSWATGLTFSVPPTLAAQDPRYSDFVTPWVSPLLLPGAGLYPLLQAGSGVGWYIQLNSCSEFERTVRWRGDFKKEVGD